MGSKGKKNINKALRGCGLGLAAMVLALGLHWHGWLFTLENKSWDFRASVLADSQKASPNVVLILLDQNSLDWAGENMGLTWPWPREIYGAVVDFCRRNGAAGLGFDVIYSEPSSYGVADDHLFGNAIEKAGNVANALVLGTSSGQDKIWPSSLVLQAFTVKGLDRWINYHEQLSPDFTGITLPIAAVAGASEVLCNVNLAPDRDGVYRRVPVFSRFKGQAVPSLGLGLFLAAHSNTQAMLSKGSLALDDYSIPLDSQGRAILNYRGPSGTHGNYSAAWVLQSELRARSGQTPNPEVAAAFKGKYVFFGFSAPGLFDIHSSPVDSQCPGVEIHATMLDNLLSQDFISPVPLWITLIFSLVLVLLCGMLMALYSRALPLFSLVLVFLALPIVFGFLAYFRGVWLPMALPLAGMVLTIALSLIFNYATEGRRRRFIKQAFNHYLSAQVIDQILQNPDRLRLGGERRTLSIFFSDLESFTSLSETLEPEALVLFLNQYLTAMTDIIHNLGGTIDKYEGDAIIAFWNAPLESVNHAAQAVRAALECQACLKKMRSELKEQTGQDVRMRIGINTGTAVVGNLGSNTRFDYTMIGDSVNLAARLESANKQFGTYTMVSGMTKDDAGTSFSYRPLGKIRVKGRAQAVDIYEPLDGARAKLDKVEINVFEQGLSLYGAGQFDQAMTCFATLEANDPAARAYAGICRRYMDTPPSDWDGVWPLNQK